MNDLKLSGDSLTLFQRINIANCAMQRANEYVFDEARFNGEYKTARTWSKYKCIITKQVQYVEND